MSKPIEQSSDIAIIGLSGLFAGSKNKDAFWENIIRKVDNVKIAPDSWAFPWYEPEKAGSIDSGRIRTKKVGLIGDLAVFNPLEFGIPPNAVEGDPAHFLALQLAGDALKDANYGDRPFDHERTGIIVGHGSNPNRGDTIGLQYSLAIQQTIEVLNQLLPDVEDDTLDDIREALKENLPNILIEQAPSLISNVISGRIANRLDLMGPNYMIDAACSSSLIAVDLGIKDLLARRCDMMVVGGVQASMPAQIYMLFEKLDALSPSNIRPFDQAGNGTLLSEGVGFVVLKRLDDAIRDEDKIYAVIKGVGLASDGKAMGLLAPRLEGETLAIERAYAQTGVDPATIGLIEAHGTGIPLGDRTEIQALTNVFGKRKGKMPGCAIGSVKSMIGHCIPASGVASLIKMSLSLRYKVLPPTLCETVNPDLELEQTPFYVNTELRPWIHGKSHPRRAGINAFGFGGINAHAILEEYQQPSNVPANRIGKWLINEKESVSADDQPNQERKFNELTWNRWGSELIVYAGENRAQIIEQAQATIQYVNENPGASLDQLAYQQSLNSKGPARMALIAKDVSDLSEKLTFFLGKLAKSKKPAIASRKGMYYSEEPPKEGKVAFLFSSEGSQYPNMLADLCFHFPQARKWFDYLDQTFPRSPSPGECIFPPPTCLSDDERKWAAAQLFEGDLATESVSTASHAFYEILRDLGVDCDVMIGHSAGEHVALRCAGRAKTESMEQMQKELRMLNKVYEELERSERIVTGKVLSVGALDFEKVNQLLQEFPDTLYLVADNCPNQAILFSLNKSCQAAIDRIRAQGGICVELPFDRAYHTPLFEKGVDVLRNFYQRDVQQSESVSTPVYSCSTALPYPDDITSSLEVAAQQWMKPVLFRETIETVYSEGVRTFVELGASNSLTAFVDSILKGKKYLAVASNMQGKSALEQFQHLMAKLFVNKVDLNMEPLYTQRGELEQDQTATTKMSKDNFKMILSMDLPRLSLDEQFLSEVREKLHPKVEPVQQVPPGEPTPAPKPVEQKIMQGVDENREQVLSNHFELMQEFLESQTRVSEMLGSHIDKSDEEG